MNSHFRQNGFLLRVINLKHVDNTNRERPLVAVERMIDLPPRSRNEAMASLYAAQDMSLSGPDFLDRNLDSGLVLRWRYKAEIKNLLKSIFKRSRMGLWS